MEKIVVVLRCACKDLEEEHSKSYLIQFPNSDSLPRKIETPSFLFVSEYPLGYSEWETSNLFQQGSTGVLNPEELFPLKLFPTKFPVKFWVSVVDFLKQPGANVRSEFKRILQFINDGKTHSLFLFKVTNSLIFFSIQRLGSN